MLAVNNIALHEGQLIQKRSLDGSYEPSLLLPSQYDNLQMADVYQKIYAYLLRDASLDLVACVGLSGTGKTLLTVQYALESLRRKEFGDVLITKPLIGVSRSRFLGTLPGTVHEKIAPFLESYYIAAENLRKGKEFESAYGDGLIDFAPVEFMRGNSFEGTLVIADEFQNFTKHEILTLVTRIGKGSKLILLGDPNQIDLGDREQSEFMNFICHPKFKSSAFTASCVLKKNMRSPIVNLVQDIYYQEQEMSVDEIEERISYFPG